MNRSALTCEAPRHQGDRHVAYAVDLGAVFDGDREEQEAMFL
jgi:hypothetical protein